MAGMEIATGQLVTAPEPAGIDVRVDALVRPARCSKCVHRTRFDGAGIALYLCMAQPYEEDAQFGVVTWLDTANFESGECLIFKEA
jgi:hypothetical protein